MGSRGEAGAAEHPFAKCLEPRTWVSGIYLSRAAFANGSASAEFSLLQGKYQLDRFHRESVDDKWNQRPGFCILADINRQNRVTNAERSDSKGNQTLGEEGEFSEFFHWHDACNK